jgi:Bacterial dnaA protein helix-turn-helix
VTLLEGFDNPWRRPRPAAFSPQHLGCLLEMATAAVFDVSPAALQARSRGAAPVAFARQIAIYLAHVVFGLNYRDAGRLFHRDRTTAAHACRLVEDRRDDPVIDDRLDLLEAMCLAVVGEGLVPAVRQ